jgi:hypothetical protein
MLMELHPHLREEIAVLFVNSESVAFEDILDLVKKYEPLTSLSRLVEQEYRRLAFNVIDEYIEPLLKEISACGKLSCEIVCKLPESGLSKIRNGYTLLGDGCKDNEECTKDKVFDYLWKHCGNGVIADNVISDNPQW